MAEVTVLGIGNLLMRDEGIGVRLLAAARDARDWPEQIEFVDGGAGGLNLLNVIEQARRLVVFDAADMQLAPGECRVVEPEQIADEPPEHRVSLHDLPFMETLKLCRRFTRGPGFVRLLVVQPKTIEFSRQLSEDLTKAFGSLVETAVTLLTQVAREAGLAT